jgi:molybdopterin converting factor small subunit
MTQPWPTPRSVKVVFSGLIQHSFGSTEQQVAMPPGGTVRDLLQLLFRKHGEAFQEALFVGAGNLVPNAIVLVDGRDIRHHNGLDLCLDSQLCVELLVLPPATGGG